MARPRDTDRGFTIIELLVTLAIIATLVLMAVPMFVSTKVTAAERSCLGNQRALEGMASVWVASGAGAIGDLTGVVNSTHPLASELGGGRVPRCPNGGTSVDPDNPTVAEGAYAFGAAGTVAGCTLGELGPHGHY